MRVEPSRRAAALLAAGGALLALWGCGPEPAPPPAGTGGAARAGADDRGASGPPAVPHGDTRAHGGAGDGTGGHRAEARLHAAASLVDVLGEIAKGFEPLRGSRVVASYGASGTLAQQIREGAMPGVFIASSAAWADRVVEWGLAEPGTRVDLLTNALVVVVPKDATARPARLADLAGPEFSRIAVGDPEAVPAGTYARAALERAGLWERLRSRVVSAPDVRAALVYVERGEVPAGIVYATDAVASERVDTAFRIAAELHPPIVYPMLLVRGANRRSRELYDHLRSDAARAVFERAGFTGIREGGAPAEGR